jgi:hypothetical protein
MDFLDFFIPRIPFLFLPLGVACLFSKTKVQFSVSVIGTVCLAIVAPHVSTSRLGVESVLVAGIWLTITVAILMEYNKMNRWRNDAQRALSNIVIAEDRRNELCAALAGLWSDYLSHEKNIYLSASNTNSISDPIIYFTNLAQRFPQISSISVCQLAMKELIEATKIIQEKREAFNYELIEYNNLIQSFPYSMIAGDLGFEEMDEYQSPPTRIITIRPPQAVGDRST